MPFKLQNNRMIEVKHETVFGRCVEVSALYSRETMIRVFLRGINTNCLRCGTIFECWPKYQGCPYCRKKRKARK